VKLSGAGTAKGWLHWSVIRAIQPGATTFLQRIAIGQRQDFIQLAQHTGGDAAIPVGKLRHRQFGQRGSGMTLARCSTSLRPRATRCRSRAWYRYRPTRCGHRPVPNRHRDPRCHSGRTAPGGCRRDSAAEVAPATGSALTAGCRRCPDIALRTVDAVEPPPPVAPLAANQTMVSGEGLPTANGMY
jgi:hypothetical protein